MPPCHQGHGGQGADDQHGSYSAMGGRSGPTGQTLRPRQGNSAFCNTGVMSVSPVPAQLPDPTATPGTAFGVYVHVPFCASRCGYCDFNTYTAGELRGATPDGWLAAVRDELALAGNMLGGIAVDSVFVGGGTPSVLGASRLADVLDAVRAGFELRNDVEITTEANPESTSPEFFDDLLAAGYNRVSLGMQSISARVLAVLDRVHSPGRAPAAAREALVAGFTHVNLDLIYGTPGESDADLLASVEAVLDAGVDHVSAYGLVVEDGTALARRVRRGEVAAPDDDVLAHRYQLIDQRLSAAGLHWYEVSNWSRPGGQCRHNEGYWGGGQWWGAGPGAHSFVGDLRWWNVKHPRTYADSLARGGIAVGGFERLDGRDRHTEQVLLGIRLGRGLAAAVLTEAERSRAWDAVSTGLLRHADDRFILTDRGRLLADAVVCGLLDD